MTCVQSYNIVSKPKGWDDERIKKAFFNRLDVEIQNNTDINFREVDMVFILHIMLMYIQKHL